ncbi:procathepsin L-like isoform X3 [Crassostrea angulata]|uniref:procathepsin L-like isoform X3 n=1 Tax=Magallana angulata TaxID=2784310 RepID=UPI0022B19D3D|nr:procathepsin L-like isoform X3 [Crassostrea angulata]
MALKYLLVLEVCVFAAFGGLSDLFLDKEWEEFKRIYSKTYTNQEENRRKSIWLKNIDIINKHNIKADMGYHSYRLGMNKFGDMGFCLSCWAFAATGGLEGQHFRKTKKLVRLSEQNLVDCSKENLGCTAGTPENALNYIARNGGLDKEVSYPYVGKNGRCRFRPTEVGANCQGIVHVPAGDELSLQKAVGSIGPIVVSLDASKRSFKQYRNGVYDDKACSKKLITHYALIVGYGEFQKKKYWLIKNSWGTSWGMDGYMMLARNQDNMCGIANQAIYPSV